MSRIRILAVANLITLLLHIIFSYGSQAGWVAEKTNAEVSNLYPTLFTPAGFTFAIWGLIYIGLLSFCIYHVVKAFKNDEQHIANQNLIRMGFSFTIAQLATVAWLFAFGNEQLLYSMLLLFVQLVMLIYIHVRLKLFNWNKQNGSILFTQIPLSIYLGWLCIASIANTSIYLSSIGWDGLGIGFDTWTLIMIGVAVLLGLLMIFFRNNFFFALVFCWALFGILTRLNDIPGKDYDKLINSLGGGIILLLIGIIVKASILRARRGRMQSPLNS